jgi:hypothetical protein
MIRHNEVTHYSETVMAHVVRAVCVCVCLSYYSQLLSREVAVQVEG